MDEKNLDLLAEYEMVVRHTKRVKGAYILDTEKGLMLFTAYSGTEKKAAFVQQAKDLLLEKGYERLDHFVKTKDGRYVVESQYGDKFILKRWFDAEECVISAKDQVMAAAKYLAELHNDMEGLVPQESENYNPKELSEVLSRRVRELNRVKVYVKEKKQKNLFETMFIKRMEPFYEEAVQAEKDARKLELRKFYDDIYARGSWYHGNYTHHNVLFGDCDTPAVVNFDRCCVGVHIMDFYLFYRKMMEKSDWNIELGYELLNEYEGKRSLSAEEKKIFVTMLRFPEKFWKITNSYYNNRKTWIPQKNLEKLIMVCEQQEKREVLLRTLFTL